MLSFSVPKSLKLDACDGNGSLHTLSWFFPWKGKGSVRCQVSL